MAKIIKSLEKLTVEKDATQKQDENQLLKKGTELSLVIEEVVLRNKHYILGVCGTQSTPEFRIGTALSNYSCAVYTVGESISHTISLTHNESPVVGIKFSPMSKNILYTATRNGQITACDLRAKGKVVAQFKDNTEDGKIKPLASFDISCDERLVAGGTEHIGGDVFILFWDIRHTSTKLNGKSNLLGGYWESHMEDVVSLAFHSNKADVLASGSTDGLINIFDLTQPTEDLALMYSLNTESSVGRLGWQMNDSLWCTTQSDSLQLWKCDAATPYARFQRNDIALMQNDYSDDCYLVKYHYTTALGQPFLLSGSNAVSRKNLCCLYIMNDQLEMGYNLIGNKQIVRDSWLHEQSGCLITAGEDGIINIWKQTDSSSQLNSGHKMIAKIGTGKTRDRQHRTKPY